MKIVFFLICICSISSSGQTKMKKGVPQKISISTFRELIRDFNGTRSMEFSSDLIDAFVLEDGRLLFKVHHDSSASVYKSIDEYLALTNKEEEEESPYHILKPYQKDISTLPDNIPSILASLSGRLRLKIDAKEMTDQDLKLIDRSVKKYLSAHNSDAVFFELVVLIGEYIRKKTNSEWVVISATDDPDVKECYVKDQNGKLYNTWLIPAKRLDEGKDIILESIIDSILTQPSFSVQKQ